MKKNIILIHGVDVPQQGAIDLFYYTKYLSLSHDINVKTIISNFFLSNNDLFMKESFIEIGNNYNKGLLSSIKFIYYGFLEIKKINNAQKIDYVHFFSMHPMSIILQFMVKYILKIDTIYDIISGPIGKGPIYYISYITEKLGIILSTKYIIDHKKLIKLLGFSKKKEHIELGIGCEIKNDLKYKNYLDKKDNEIIFMYIGSLNIDRELSIVIDVFNKLSNKKGLVYRLVIIGKGDDENNLKEKSLTGNIDFLGYKHHSEISSYMNCSDVLISYVPQKKYFDYQPPTKLLEGLAVGKPVIATGTFAQKEILKNYSGLIFDDNVKSLFNKIIDISYNLDKYPEKDMKNIVEKYTWEKLVNNKLIPFYLK